MTAGLELVLFILAVLFSLNIGGANFAASFGAAYGSGSVSRRNAVLLFTLCVVLGSVTLGERVGTTLNDRIIDSSLFTTKNCVIIFAAATSSLMISNLLKVPQSTSLVTIGAILGVGLASDAEKWSIFVVLVPAWILLPAFSYVFTSLVGKLLYPPRKKNLKLYEKLVTNESKLRWFVLFASCYNAFAVGANNLANVAAPVYASHDIGPLQAFLLFSLVCGAGGYLFRKPLELAGKEIVPLGVFSASLIYIVISTLMIAASWLGIPQSYVHLKMVAIFAISGVKQGHRETLKGETFQSSFWAWIFTPLIACGVSFGLMKVLL